MSKHFIFLYNYSGENKNLILDFKENVLKSLPQIRKDKKILFSLDSANTVARNGKYLYFELEDKEITRSNIFSFIRKNNIREDLQRLCHFIGMQSDEIDDFVRFCEFDLLLNGAEFFKCEIYNKVDKVHQNILSPIPEFNEQRFLRFSSCEKLGKQNIQNESFRVNRKGEIRCFEIGYSIIN